MTATDHRVTVPIGDRFALSRQHDDPRDSFPFDCSHCGHPTDIDGPCERCQEPLAVVAREADQAADCVLCGRAGASAGICGRHATDPAVTGWNGARP